MRFAGKIAVVTGAASGIGKATVLKLAGEGAHVFAADIDEAGGQALAAKPNRTKHLVRCGVTVARDLEGLRNDTGAKGGGAVGRAWGMERAGEDRRISGGT